MKAMHKLAALALCVVAPVLGAPQQSPNYHEAYQALGRRAEAERQCYVRTITYLTTYGATAIVTAPNGDGQQTATAEEPYPTEQPHETGKEAPCICKP